MAKGFAKQDSRSHSRSTKSSFSSIQKLLPSFMKQVGTLYQERPDLVVTAWPQVIGPRLAPMTKARSFVDGVLTVVVSNSTLYSLLNQSDKPRLIQNLRSLFPNTVIKTIIFRLG